MTPHNRAKKGEIAKVVLMGGDPMRMKWIAENFLTDVRLVNNVRCAWCYTGQYKGKEVSVMAHGMGIPSIGIYSYELFNMYDVDTIIRIGSTGSYVPHINVNDLVLVNEAYSASTYGHKLGITDDVLFPDVKTNQLILETAKELKMDLKTVRCHSSDNFYTNVSLDEWVNQTKADCVEMEAYGLFVNANILKKHAAVLLTCSDSLVTNESLDPELRETSFKNMVKLALESALKIL